MAVKNTQHGIQFQIIITTQLSLSYIEEVKNKELEFQITPEAKKCGIFDDIRYKYKYKGDVKENVFLVQAKHSQKNQSTIKLNDFITKTNKGASAKFKTNLKDKPFLIEAYFTTFYDLKISEPDRYRLILCTNQNIDNDAKEIWNLVQEPVDPLDNHLLGLFKNVGSKCYRLEYNKSKNQNLTEMFENCSESARLAKLLVNYAILKNREINQYIPLFAKYRNALRTILVLCGKPNYKFEIDILTSSGEVFITEFIKHYRKAFSKLRSIDDVWEHLRGQTVRVSAKYMQSNGASESPFPNDRVTPENIHSFCKKFRLVCDLPSQTKLNNYFETYLQCLFKDDSKAFPVNRMIEINRAVQEVQTIVTNCLCSLGEVSFESKDVIDCVNYAILYADIFKQDTITREKYFKSKSLFRIDEECLKKSELYKVMEQDPSLTLNTCDIEYGVTILLDIIDVQGRNSDKIFVLDASQFFKNPKNYADFLKKLNQSVCIMIIYDGEHTEQDNVKCLEEIATKERKNWVFLIKRTKDTENQPISALLQTNQNIYQQYNTSFHIRDLKEGSRESFFKDEVTLCHTIILAREIFEIDCNLFLVEHVIKQINCGKQMKAPIEREYEKIMKSGFVERHCVQNTKQENATHETDQNQLSEIKLVISEIQQKKMSSSETVAHFKQSEVVNQIFEIEKNLHEAKSPTIEIGVEDRANKVIIIRDGINRGKSTYLTWLARNLQQKNRKLWIILCNLSDPLILSRVIEISANSKETGSEVSSILYQWVYLYVNGKLPPDCIGENAFTNPTVDLSENFNEHATFDDLVNFLVFCQQLSKRKLVLLFDGLDALKGDDQNKMLIFLCRLAKLDGVLKLYLASSNGTAVEKVFNDTLPTYQLQPASIKQIAAMLYKTFESKFEKAVNKEEKCAFTQLVCLIIINRLAAYRKNLSKFMCLVHTICGSANHYINKEGIVNVEKLNAMLEKMHPADGGKNLVRNFRSLNLS